MHLKPLGSTGLLVAPLGFGAAPLGRVYGEQSPETAERSVHLAIDHGINLFDVSPYYGLTLAEEVLGRALGSRRNEIVLSTKCGRNGLEDFDFSAAGVRRSVEASLRRLRTDRLDLLLAHDIEFADPRQIVEETIPALHLLAHEGKTRAVGITGYPPARLQAVAQAAPVDCILSYCRYTLLTRDLASTLGPYAQAAGVGLMNASPLAMGLLTEDGPPAWHPAPQPLRALAQQVVALCRSYGAEAPSVGLHFAMSCPGVAATLSGMRTEAEVLANLRALEATPPAGLLEAIEAAVVASGIQTTWPSGRDPA